MKEATCVVVFLWVVLNAFVTLMGICDGGLPVKLDAGCQHRHNIDYIVPGYMFGCWLTERR